MKFNYPSDEGVDYDAFLLLNNDLIEKLVKKIGDRAKFIDHFYKFKNTINLDTSNSDAILLDQTLDSSLSDTPSSSRASTCTIVSDTEYSVQQYNDFLTDTVVNQIPSAPPSQQAFIVENIDDIVLVNEKFDLKELLQQTVAGREILNSKQLTPNLRNKLTSLLVNYELNRSETISTQKFIELARHIKKVFPAESIATYYTPFTKMNNTIRRLARGKLIDKYHNLRKRFKKVGLFASNLTTVVGENMQNKATTIREQDFELVEEKLTWLKNNNNPWPTVTENWALTTSRRMDLYNTTNCTISEYLNTYPALKQPLGYELYEIDFQNLFSEKCNMLYGAIATLKNKIFKFAETTSGKRDPNMQQYLNIYKQNEDEDCENAICFLIVSYIACVFI